MILSNDSFRRSRRTTDVLPISPITLSRGLAVTRRVIPSSQVFTKFLRSRSSSATSLFSATVRMMTPKFSGLIDCIRRSNRFRSSLLVIFFETLTAFEKGTNTKYLPARDNSQDSRGPFVEIGSFTI